MFDRGSPRELIERFGREDMEEVFLDMARGRGRGLDGLHKKEAASMSGSAQRIWALVMRHIYIWRSSVMRLVDSIYWPAVQMVMWGFMTQYLLPQASFVAQAAGVLLSGLLLWEVVVRGNLSLSIAFLEEMWSRNLGHLFVSPIRSWEMATGIIIAALLRTLLGLVPVSLMAWAFFGYSIYALGLPLIAFFAILQMFSWSIGLAMSGMIMRVGQSAESFAWAAVFILMPVSGVYYPVSVLPHWLQVISYGLPPAYVFEGMRAILAEKTVHWDMLGIAFGLSVVYLVDRLPDLPVVLPLVAPRRVAARPGRMSSRRLELQYGARSQGRCAARPGAGHRRRLRMRRAGTAAAALEVVVDAGRAGVDRPQSAQGPGGVRLQWLRGAAG